MRKILTSFAIIVFSTVIVFDASENDSSERVLGLNIYHSLTGSGYGCNTRQFLPFHVFQHGTATCRYVAYFIG